MPASVGQASSNSGSRVPKALRTSVRSPDSSSGWNKKTQAAGIAVTAGNGEAIEEAVCRHGGLAGAMTARFCQDQLTQIQELQGAGRVAASELHRAKLTWTPTIDEMNDIAELTPCFGRAATMSIRPKPGGKNDQGVEIHNKLWKTKDASVKKPVQVCDYSVQCQLKVKTLVTLDPVDLGRVPVNGEKHSDKWVNYYQTKAGAFTGKDVSTGEPYSGGSPLSKMLKGKSFPGADTNKDAFVDFKGVFRKFSIGSIDFECDGSGVNHDVAPAYFYDEAVNALK